MNPFFELASLLESFVVSGNNGVRVDSILQNHFPEMQVQDARIAVLLRMRECARISGQLDTAEDRNRQRSDFINELARSYSLHMNSNLARELSSNLAIANKLETLRAYGDVFSSKKTSGAFPAINRIEVASGTEALREAFAKLDLDPYAKRFVDISLSSLQRVLMEDLTYSDEELRQRIKSIYADFCIQFDTNDQRYKTTAERLLDFAKQYGGYGVAALAIGSDLSQVMALLPAP